jgi:4-amino-4-deoxy-L-arabinose transferase-like glycosyltransferase
MRRPAGRKIIGERSVPRLALGIAACHFLLSLLYSLVIPPWEGVDEWSHYKYAEYVALRRALPDPRQRLNTEYAADQASQPPLYYILTAPAILLVSPSDGYRVQVNPYGEAGGGTSRANLALHDPAVERFPWRGTILALHLSRLVSVLLGTLALWPTYALGRLLFPRAPAIVLGATAFQAFLPQYVYMGSIVHNDVLVALVGGLVLYLAVRVALGRAHLPELAALMGATALLFWSKANGLALLPLAIPVLLGGLVRQGRRLLPRRLSFFLLASGAVALALLAMGWMGRNLITMGSPFPRFGNWPWEILYWVYRQPELASVLHWEALPRAWPSLPYTFWGLFGWENIPTFPWFYTVGNSLAVAALAGVLLSLAWPRYRGAREGLLLILLAVASVMLMAIYRVLLFEGGLPGRYLFPALSGLGILFAAGLTRLLPVKAEGAAMALVGITFASVSLASLYLHIRPAYALPRPLSPEEIPASAQPLQARFADVAELVAYELEPSEVKPGEVVHVTLYWRVLARTSQNYTVGIHLLGPRLEDYGMLNTYPGQGKYATTFWEPGVLFRETARVVARPTGPLPSLGRVSVALFPPDAPLQGLTVYDREGRPLGGSVIFGRLRLSPAQPAPPPPLTNPTAFAFGPEGNIRLRSADFAPQEPPFIRASLTLTLTWQSVSPLPTSQDVHVFVHLVDGAGEVVAQADAPPGGDLLPTGLWRAGDWAVSVHHLAVPRFAYGAYELRVGLYVLASGERLTAWDAAGREAHEGSVVLLRWHRPPAAFAFVPLSLRGHGDR